MECLYQQHFWELTLQIPILALLILMWDEVVRKWLNSRCIEFIICIFSNLNHPHHSSSYCLAYKYLNSTHQLSTLPTEWPDVRSSFTSASNFESLTPAMLTLITKVPYISGFKQHPVLTRTKLSSLSYQPGKQQHREQDCQDLKHFLQKTCNTHWRKHWDINER